MSKMNKIEKLIAELCPDGVEFKELGEVCEVISGQSPEGKNYNNNKKGIPFYQGKTEFQDMYVGEPQKWTTKTTKIALKDDILMSVRAPVGPVNLAIQEICIGRGLASIRGNREKINQKYLFYILRNKEDSIKGNIGAVFESINKNDIKKTIIPIPPLDIQKEIVKILDNFTKLEAELEARRKQCEYYREELLSFGDEVEFKELGEVCEKTTNIKWQYNKNKSFQYIDLTSVNKKTNLVTKIKRITSETAPNRAQQIVKTGDVIFGTTRPTLKRFCVIKHEYNEQICSTGFCILRPKIKIVLTNYIFHFISTSDFYNYTESNQKGASYPAISNSIVKNYKISIPSLSEQKRVVSILDKFDALVNDISTGLPAEIKARRKQYEYYRNKLLTFKPLEEQNVK